MILTDKQILEFCEHPANKDAILEATALQDVHKVHVTGEKYQDYIKRIIGKENFQDYGQKKELSESVTVSITGRIIDEQSRWKDAGSKHFFEFKDNADRTKEFTEKVLSQVWKGDSMEVFVKSFLRDALYTEFNGFVIVEQGKIDKIKDGKKELIVETRDGIVSVVENADIKPYLIFNRS